MLTIRRTDAIAAMRNLQSMKRLTVAVSMSVFGVGFGPAAADEVEIVSLRHRTLDQVLPVLEPLVERGGAVTGMGGQIILRASRRNIEQLKQVLAAIDTPPRRLIISVRQTLGATAARDGVSVSGSIGTPAGAVAGDRAARSAVEARVTSSRDASDDRVTQQVQTMDGAPAFIQIGRSVPAPARTVQRLPGGGIIVSESTALREQATGFTVLPRLAGERVTLDIQPRQDGAGADGRPTIQRVASTVSGRLGEWIELGGLDQSASATERGIVASRAATQEEHRRVWVKVDEVP